MMRGCPRAAQTPPRQPRAARPPPAPAARSHVRHPALQRGQGALRRGRRGRRHLLQLPPAGHQLLLRRQPGQAAPQAGPDRPGQASGDRGRQDRRGAEGHDGQVAGGGVSRRGRLLPAADSDPRLRTVGCACLVDCGARAAKARRRGCWQHHFPPPPRPGPPGHPPPQPAGSAGPGRRELSVPAAPRPGAVPFSTRPARPGPWPRLTPRHGAAPLGARSPGAPGALLKRSPLAMMHFTPLSLSLRAAVGPLPPPDAPASAVTPCPQPSSHLRPHPARKIPADGKRRRSQQGGKEGRGTLLYKTVIVFLLSRDIFAPSFLHELPGLVPRLGATSHLTTAHFFLNRTPHICIFISESLLTTICSVSKYRIQDGSCFSFPREEGKRCAPKGGWRRDPPGPPDSGPFLSSASAGADGPP